MVLIRLKEAAKYTGLHPNTLRRYIDQGVIKGIRLGSGGHRFVEKSELDKLKGTTTEEPKGVAVYVRVSTRKQQEAGNLERQRERLLAYCASQGLKVAEIVEDIASGINENRRGLEKVLKLARRRKIDAVVAEYKDRLARFGFQYLKEALTAYGTKVIVVEEDEAKSPNEELVEDLISVVSSSSSEDPWETGSKKNHQGHKGGVPPRLS